MKQLFTIFQNIFLISDANEIIKSKVLALDNLYLKFHPKPGTFIQNIGVKTLTKNLYWSLTKLD